MGILRTDKISGLETPTAVTGSVVFDGSGDYLQITPDEDFAFGNSDFTIETWAYFDTVSSGSGQIYEGRPSGTQGAYVSLYFSADNTFSFYTDSAVKISGTVTASRWYHIALVRNSGTTTLYLDGISQGTYSDSQSYLVRSDGPIIGVARNESNNPLDGYLSNYRILKGTALYTSDFTPPTHALEVIGDTILLCCNNSDSAGADGTGKTVTANGNAAASTFSPDLTRDFTHGTEFNGVTTFDTQGYFVPPSGTTEQRGAGKAVFAGGYVPGGTITSTIESVNINSLGNATKFGTLKLNCTPTSTSSATRQLVAGGYVSPAVTDNIDYITIASSSNSVDFGTLGTARRDMAGLSNNTRSVFGGGTTTGSTTPTTNMEYVTSASLGSATPFGTLTASGRANAACASPTRGMFFGGYQAFATPVSTYTNVINYITIATTGNGTDFGDLAVDNNGQKAGLAAFSSSTRGVVGGGAIYGPDAPAYTPYDTIEYVTIASTGNAQDFGNLTGVNNYLSGTTNSVRGIFNQGSSPTYLNTIQYVTIASTGDAQDFGDCINDFFTYNNAGSDSHGGIS